MRWRMVLRAAAAGALCALVGIVLVMTPVGATLEQNTGLKWLFRLRGPLPTPAEVVIAAIDDQTGGHLGVSNLPREWPRTVHAQLVDNLVRRGASAIVFDFDFQIPKNPGDDAAFAQAVNAAGRVVLAEKLLGKRQPLLDKTGQQQGSVWIEKLVAPIESLSAAARGLGPFPLPKVEEAVHEFWAFKPSVGGSPTLPAVGLQIHALASYPKLVTLAGTLPTPVVMPAPPTDDARAETMRAFMLQLRNTFMAQPTLATALRRQVASLPGNTPAQTRQQLLGLIALYAENDHRHLNFYGSPGRITTIPYHVLAAAPDTAEASTVPDLQGKTVFVGFSDLYDPGQPDRFYTVYTNDEGVDLSGVEIAATAFANMLNDESVNALDPLQVLGLLGIIGFGAGVMVYLLPTLVGVPLTLALAAAYAYGTTTLFGSSHLWLPLATPLLVQVPLALFIGLIAQYLGEREKKTRVTQAISMYLPAHLAHDFTEKRLDDSAINRVTYSVCFASDMAGFTSISEKLKPKELAAFLNDYFESLAAPLRQHGVDVIEFRADGIMCAWTAPQEDVGIRRQALAAALDSLTTMAQFKERHELLAQSLRIGLESGMVYVGHAGGGGHFVYSIVGDCANTAARIEGLNKHLGTQLLASAETVAEVPGLVLREVGEFKFVGKGEAQPIVEVLGAEGSTPGPLVALAERFNAAMVALRDWRIEDAGELFVGIQRDYPNDGPTRYHLERCRRFLASPPSEPPWVVNMDSK